MNAFEREALDVLGSRLDAYPEEQRVLGRLDDRVVGWMIFRPHVVLAALTGGLGSLLVVLWQLSAGGPWARPTAVAVAVLTPGGWLLGRWLWSHYVLPWLELLADAVAAGRGQRDGPVMPLTADYRVSAAVSRLRRIRARESGDA